MGNAIRAVLAFATLVACALAFAPPEASAHDRRHYRERRPPVAIAPGHRAKPYPYWYYGRPEPRRHAPPTVVAPRSGHKGKSYPYWYYGRPEPHRQAPFVVAPAPRHDAPPRRLRHGHHPGASFHFRF